MTNKEILQALQTLPLDAPAAKAISFMLHTEVTEATGLLATPMPDNELQYQSGRIAQAMAFKDLFHSMLTEAHKKTKDSEA